jgi:hypothetical protein
MRHVRVFHTCCSCTYLVQRVRRCCLVPRPDHPSQSRHWCHQPCQRIACPPRLVRRPSAESICQQSDVPEQHLGPDNAVNGCGGIGADRAHWIGLGRGFGLALKTLCAHLAVLAGLGTVLRIENELHLSQIALRA